MGPLNVDALNCTQTFRYINVVYGKGLCLLVTQSDTKSKILKCPLKLPEIIHQKGIKAYHDITLVPIATHFIF